MPNGAVTSPNGEVTPQSDSFLGVLLELLKGRWTEREEQTGQPMGIQNVAALSTLEFLKPPQKMVPTKNPKLLKMGLKEEMNPEYLQMVAMGAMSPSKMEKLAKLGGKFYHGGAEKIALKKGMTFHAGTKEAALERIGRYSQRNQPRAVYEVEIKPKKPYLKKGRILDERIPEDRTELYYLQNLPHKRDELAKLGYDVVPYINATEDVGSLSMMVLKRGSARMTGKMERGKTTHAGKWKPSAPKNLDERKEFFNKEIAQAQRGVPETKMVELQHVAGGGPISHVSESVGDLIDRIYGTPQKHGGRGWAWEATREKINRSLATLEDAYGFKRWVSENATANAKAQGISIAQYKKGVDRALKEYADAHRNIPTYNKVQKLANDAAVAFGEKNFDLTIKNLKILRNYMDEGFESWEKRVYSLSRK